MLCQLVPYMRFVKVGSGDLTNYKFFEILSSYQKPIVLSTGIADIQEVEAAVNMIEKFYSSCDLGNLNHHILQCTSMYPIEFSDANLNVMGTYKNLFPDYQVGYSDHTIGTTAISGCNSYGSKDYRSPFY